MQKKLLFGELVLYLAKYKKHLAGVAFALIAVAAALLSLGVAFREFVDQAFSNSQPDIVGRHISILFFLIIIFSVGSFFRSYLINLTALKVSSAIKTDAYKSLLNISIIRFEELKIGDIISRLSSDIEAVNGLVINLLSFLVRNFIMIIGSVILMFTQSIKLSSLVLICIPLSLIPIIGLSKKVRALSRQTLTKQGNFAAGIEESFLGVRTVYAYNQQARQVKHFNNEMRNFQSLANERLRYRSLFFALTITIIALSIIAIIWVGSIDIINGRITSGTMLSFVYYAVIAGLSTGGFVEIFSELQGPFASLERVLEIRDMSNIQPNVTAVTNVDFTGNIEYKNITFSYPSRPKNVILHNISLVLEAGKFTGIVGKSGSGKSTLLQLLMRFYNFNQGNIYIKGRDIRQLESRHLRSKIAYVEQSPFIFSGSILNNVTFSNPDAPSELVEKIIKECGINDFADEFPKGIKTLIGERGVRLSGGQKQRIAIARALLYQPEILLLDEATSAIDSQGEKLLLDAVQKIMSGKTIISIAHRVSSIENADNILVIEQGLLKQQGKHRELIKQEGPYKSLYQQQLHS